MGAIQVLRPDVANKIAAGEVVERPASIVKELLENAVDAGATRIDVEVEHGGRALVRVRDNGRGIVPDDVPLAFLPYATSKLSSADDLFRIETMGFRGEALASIGSVAQCRLRSRTADEPLGRQIDVAGGQVSEMTECGGPVGTTIEVRQLFFNMPVRRKFLRTVQTEMGHITDAFTRIALARPDIQMTLRHNGNTVFELPGADQLRRRLGLFFGRELTDALVPIEQEGRGVRLTGYVAKPSVSRANAGMQYLFLNGRYIRDRQCLHAVREAYRGLLTTGRQPVAFLFLELSPEAFDVNVHPTKIEVRFRDGHLVYSHILSAIRQKFLQTDLTAELDTPAAPAPAESPVDGDDAARQERLRQSIADFFSRAPAETVRPATHTAHAPSPSQPAPVRVSPPPDLPASVDGPADGPLPARAVQMHDRYVVAEMPDGILIIDQHALHERILYERLRSRVTDGPLESQRLLVPEVIELNGSAQAALAREADTLARLGLEVESFGANSAAVHAYPTLLDRRAVGDVVTDLLDYLAGADVSAQREHMLEELLEMMACKAAVKAGQRLDAAEVEALLRGRDLADDAHHCPHGRPAALLLTNQDLDKQFRRT